jgi:hypothetical protein
MKALPQYAIWFHLPQIITLQPISPVTIIVMTMMIVIVFIDSLINSFNFNLFGYSVSIFFPFYAIINDGFELLTCVDLHFEYLGANDSVQELLLRRATFRSHDKDLAANMREMD